MPRAASPSSPRSPSGRCAASSTSPRASANAWRRWRGSTVGVLEQARARMTPTPGVQELIDGVHAAGGRVGVVSGGFHELLDPLAQRLGLDFCRANRLEVADGRLTGRVDGDIVDAHAQGGGARGVGGGERHPRSIAPSPWATAPTTSRCSAGRGSASRSAPSRSCASERMSRSTRPTSARCSPCSACAADRPRGARHRASGSFLRTPTASPSRTYHDPMSGRIVARTLSAAALGALLAVSGTHAALAVTHGTAGEGSARRRDRPARRVPARGHRDRPARHGVLSAHWPTATSTSPTCAPARRDHVSEGPGTPSVGLKVDHRGRLFVAGGPTGIGARRRRRHG